MEEKKRLDRILLDLGLLTEEQIKHALNQQKTHGGRFGSNLLYHHYLTEAGLVRALSLQSGFEGITLEERNIDTSILEFIPLEVAKARKVIPFDYDTKEKILKVAVADPNQPGLKEEIDFLGDGKTVKLYVASEAAVYLAIERFYLGRESSLEESRPFRIPVELSDIGNSEFNIDREEDTGSSTSSRVVIVTDEEFAGPLLKSVIERNGPRVELVHSVDEALKIIDRRFVETVLVRESLCKNRKEIEAMVRSVNFRTEFKLFPDCSQLALGSLANLGRLDILKSVELLVSLLSTVSGDRDSRAIMVGRYAARICEKLGIPNSDRQKIVSAGFLHHLSQYAGPEVDGDLTRKEIMNNTAALLDSVNFDPELVEILRQAYVEPTADISAGGMSVAQLGANILTLADHFCENFAGQAQITLVKFEEIKARYLELTESLFLPEVANAFILTIQEECLNMELTHTQGEVIFYYHKNAPVDPFVSYHLRSKGVRSTDSTTPKDLIQICKRRTPDVILIVIADDEDDHLKIIKELGAAGVDFKHSPGILITQASLERSMDQLFQAGVHDVVDDSAGYEILAAKILTMIERNRRREQENAKNSPVAQGKLANINLIDLIQALGPGHKTVRILLREGNQELSVYLAEGAIVHAALGDILGPAAIFEGITWLTGVFSVTLVNTESIPEPNVDLPNESILMEGCRLIDERARNDSR